MNDEEKRSTRSSWGSVTTCLAEMRAIAPGVTPVGQKAPGEFIYTWPPPAQLDLPPAFQLTLTAVTDSQGIRRFVPVDSPNLFVFQASLAGQAILTAEGKLRAKQAQSYRLMLLIFQRSARIRERFGRSFKRESDLWIAKSMHLDDDVLPRDLGLNCRGEGERWSVDDLLKQGRDAAVAHGYRRPDVETCVRLGLREAAQLNPWTGSPADARGLLRICLFDLGPASPFPNQVLKTRVQRRLLAAIQDHLDDSAENFTRWFFERADNLVHQVEKQKKDGGPIDRSVVRQVLLETIFDAHEYVAHAVSVAMRDFAANVTAALSSKEREFLTRVYGQHESLGGLSLIVLHERFPLIREIVEDLLMNPTDQRLMGVLLRVLQYFAFMTQARREDDRERKKRQGQHHVPLREDVVADTRGLPDSDD